VIAYDTRLKRLTNNPRFVLINNFKCGFSSSNLLAYQRVTHISAEDEIILFYRNVVSRAISVFINWCILDDRFFQQSGWLWNNLRAAWTARRYRHFLDLLQAHRYGDAFGLYVDALQIIATQDNHTLPQVALLEYYGLDRVDHFVELENCSQFAEVTGIGFPHDKTNESDARVKASVVRALSGDAAAQRVLNDVYRKDLEFFARHGLRCRHWHSLV